MFVPMFHGQNRISKKFDYGRLYNWYAINTGILAPIGWGVPTESQFNTLITNLGGELVAGGKMKETGFLRWDSPNDGATNSSGFSGRPGGRRYNLDGTFDGFKELARFWTSDDDTTVPAFSLKTYFADCNANYYSKWNGFSIRFMRETNPGVSYITDYDGYRYNIVQIGGQYWIDENWRSVKYNNGTSIPNITDNSTWTSLTTGAYCNYENDESYV